MKLPPPGSDPSEIASYVDKMFMEMAMNPRRRDWEGESSGVAWTEGAQVGRSTPSSGEGERGLNLYLGNHFETATPQGTVRIVLNRISNCILAILAIQAGDPPQITFTPRETGEPPLCFINTKMPAGQMLSDAYFKEAYSEGHPWQPGQPLPEEIVQEIRTDIQAGQQAKLAAAQQGLPEPQDVLPPEVLIEVTDATSAQAVQTVFDALWESADAQFVFVENVLNKNILGWQPELFEWDDDNRRPIETNVHPKQVFFDGLRSDLRRCQMAGFDEPISADEAVARYPRFKDAIDLTFKEGTAIVPGSRPYGPAFAYQVSLWREWGFVRHFWIRSQPYPMTPEQAEACGKIICKDVPDDTATLHGDEPAQADGASQPGSGALLPPADGVVDSASGAPVDRQVPSGEPGAGEQDLGRGGPGGAGPDQSGPVPTPTPTRKAYFHPDTGEELPAPVTDPDTGVRTAHPTWPLRYGIRQIKVVGQVAVDDRECEFPDIPLPTNINLPVPFSMYGQGESVRLEGVQMALNYLLSAIVTHQRYTAYPPEVVLESVQQMMDESLRTARSKPGQRIVVPDQVLEQIKDLKQVMTTLDPPQLPADAWKLLSFLVEIIDKEGNQSDVMAGNAAPGWSGDAISSLQNAAANVIRAKSIMTELYLRQRARLYEYCIVNRMTPQDWAAYCSKYPIEAIRALHQRNKTLERDLSVQIASGSGASKQAKTNNLIAAKQNGVPISTPTIMEHLDVDPDAEMQREADYQKKAATMGLSAGPTPAGAQPPDPGATGGGQPDQPKPLPARPAGRGLASA